MKQNKQVLALIHEAWLFIFTKKGKNTNTLNNSYSTVTLLKNGHISDGGGKYGHM